MLLCDNGATAPAPNVTLPHYKPSLLAAPPVAVSLLTAGGDKALTYSFDERGVVFPLSDLVQPVPVLLGNYYRNYSAAAAAPRHSPRGWPRPWWKVPKGSGDTRGLGRGATGSSSKLRAATKKAEENGLHAALAAGSRASLEDNAPCGTRGCGVYTTDGYVFTGTEGTCYKSAVLPGGEAAIRLDLFWNGADDNLGGTVAPSDGQQWSLVDTECFVYAAGGKGRLSLDIFVDATRSDYWTLASAASRAAALERGYSFFAHVGFVDPAPANGRLSDAQQAAEVASYAYTVRVDF